MSGKNMIALCAIQITLALGQHKTKDAPGIAPKVYEVSPGEPVTVSEDILKAHPRAFREPNKLEAKGDFKDLAGEKAEAKSAEKAGQSNAAADGGKGKGGGKGSDKAPNTSNKTGGSSGAAPGETGGAEGSGNDADLTG